MRLITSSVDVFIYCDFIDGNIVKYRYINAINILASRILNARVSVKYRNDSKSFYNTDRAISEV